MRENIRPGHRLANKIRMLHSQQTGACLIVEGTTDKKFYQNYVVDCQNCHIEIGGNKENAVQAIAILDKDNNFTGALAIVDADFDRLEGKLPTSQNILLTDNHDLETMLLQSPALDKLLTEYGSEEKLQDLKESGKDVREILIQAAVAIGYLRWVSLQQNLALKFEGLSFSKFVDKYTLAISASQLIKTVKARSTENRSEKPLPNQSEIENLLDSLKSNDHNPWDVCCGHDLIEILSLGLRKLFGSCQSKDVESDVLEKNLRLAYERSHFGQTQLYTAIQEWEKANQLQIIKLI